MAEPIALFRGTHRTAIKWHRARRRAADPVFTGERIREGLRVGASVEIDLRVHGEQGFVVLHDEVLDAETTGHGLVGEQSAARLAALHIRDNDGAPTAHRVMLLEDLVADLQTGGIHRDALLQLDFKDDARALSPQSIANFQRIVAPVASHMILSAGDADAVAVLSAGLPGLKVGYDPCSEASLLAVQRSRDFAGFVAGAVAASPQARMIYLDYRLVLFAAGEGRDLVAPFQAAGRRIDAYTISVVDPAIMPTVSRLLDLGVDQITTDDPEALYRLGTTGPA